MGSRILLTTLIDGCNHCLVGIVLTVSHIDIVIWLSDVNNRLYDGLPSVCGLCDWVEHFYTLRARESEL